MFEAAQAEKVMATLQRTKLTPQLVRHPLHGSTSILFGGSSTFTIEPLKLTIWSCWNFERDIWSCFFEFV
jgi:hypothetical protein